MSLLSTEYDLDSPGPVRGRDEFRRRYTQTLPETLKTDATQLDDLLGII